MPAQKKCSIELQIIRLICIKIYFSDFEARWTVGRPATCNALEIGAAMPRPPLVLSQLRHQSRKCSTAIPGHLRAIQVCYPLDNTGVLLTRRQDQLKGTSCIPIFRDPRSKTFIAGFHVWKFDKLSDDEFCKIGPNSISVLILTVPETSVTILNTLDSN